MTDIRESVLQVVEMNVGESWDVVLAEVDALVERVTDEAAREELRDLAGDRWIHLNEPNGSAPVADTEAARPTIVEQRSDIERGAAAFPTGGRSAAEADRPDLAPAAHAPAGRRAEERPARTDLGNAELFAELHGDRFRHVKERRAWLVWQGGRWRRDTTGEPERAAKDTARELLRRAAELDGDEQKKAVQFALASQGDHRLRAMLNQASTEPGIALAADELDRGPWLLSCGNGTLDLRTGELRAHDPRDLISLGTDVPHDAEATCPRWERFLMEIFDADEELVAYVKRALGYSLTGVTREHLLFVCHGTGRNGKGTLLDTFAKVLGDFGTVAEIDTFMRSRADRAVRNDLARLHRSRFVTASEPNEGRRLDEATVKLLTGGDTIAARFLYAEHFQFVPRFKIWLNVNHTPRADEDDEALWARLRLIPFAVSFLGREDKTLAETLEAELPGILTWALHGCLDWQQHGLGTCAAVERATSDYRKDEDLVGAFLAEKCTFEGEIEPAQLRAAYEDYCRDADEKPLAPSVLGKRLRKRGIRRGGRANHYRGLSLQ